MIIFDPPPNDAFFPGMRGNRENFYAKLKKAVSQNFWVPGEEIRILDICSPTIKAEQITLCCFPAVSANNAVGVALNGQACLRS